MIMFRTELCVIAWCVTLSVQLTSCGTLAARGFPQLSYSLSTLFSQAFVQPCCLSRGTFVQMRVILCLFNGQEFTPFSFHFSHSVQEQYLRNLTKARSSFVNLSSYLHQTIQPASIKPLVPSFLQISLPLRSFFSLSASASSPFVVSFRSPHSSCPSRSSFFSCSSRYSVLASGSVRKMDNFLAF